VKKIILISGIAAVLLFAFLAAGIADGTEAVKKALWQGNRQYASALYRRALETYETGLAANPENEALNFNAAQTAYYLGEYQKAAEYYEKAGGSVEKYINAGNIFFRAGDALEDEEQKAQCYMQALQIYLEGIIKFPQDVPLKYNYELLKEKIEITSEETERDDSEPGEEGEEGEESEKGENSEQNDGEEGEELEEGEEGEESEEAEEGEEEDLDREAIERILRMLENREAENLKNNQEIISGGDYGNDW